MFYLTKTIGGKPRCYLYEAFRDKRTGKAKRRLIAYLGSSKSLQDRIAFVASELKKARAQEARLLKVLDKALTDLRCLGHREPSPQRMERMGVRERRITFVVPGSFAASKAICPLRRMIARLVKTESRLRSITPKTAPRSR